MRRARERLPADREPEEAKAAVERKQTLETLTALGGGLTSNELAEKVELTDRTVRRFLAELLDSGHVTRTGAGKRNDTYRWSAEDGE